MRNVLLAACVTSAFSLSALACEESSSPGGGFSVPEAGTSFDGGSAPGIEAGADATPPAARGVTVTVREGTTPSADVRVIFHDASGAVIGDFKTDLAGKVTSETAPSMVTVLSRDVNGQGALAAPVTYLGVEDGDDLVVAIPRYRESEPPIVGSYSATLPPFGDASYFTASVVGTDCGAAAATIAEPLLIPLYERCLAPTSAVVISATGETSFGYAFAKGVAPPAPSATLGLGALSFAEAGATKLTASNLPTVGNTRTSLLAIAGNAAFPVTERTDDPESGSFVFATPTAFADAYQAAVASGTSTGIGHLDRVVVRREATTAPASATVALDLGTALPAVTDATLTQTVPARPRIVITAAAPLTAADGAVVRIVWSSDFTAVPWTFVVPPNVTSFDAPALPADVPPAFVPTAARIENVTYFEASALPGYKQAKSLPVSPTFFVLDFLDQPLPGDGTLRMSRLTVNDG